MSLKRVVWVGALALAGCADATVDGSVDTPTPITEGQPIQAMLQVRTLSTEGRVLEMVPFSINGYRYGITGANGEFNGPIEVKPGDVVTLSADALSGYTRAPDSEPVSYTVPTPAPGEPVVISLTTRLQAPTQDYIVLTRLGEPGLKVILNGEVVGETDAEGRAMLTISGRPDAQFSLQAGGWPIRAASPASTRST